MSTPLLAECRVEHLRSRGTRGGRRRSHKATTVRLTHLPTGTQVVATSRSQAASLAEAVERMGAQLAALASHQSAPRLRLARPKGPAATRRREAPDADDR